MSAGRTAELPPPGLSIASLYRCLRLQVCSLALAGSKSHGGCGVYHFACLFAYLSSLKSCLDYCTYVQKNQCYFLSYS